MKRWILILAAVLCIAVLLFGCGAQNVTDDQPMVSVQNKNKTAEETTAVERIVPDQKMPTEVPAQELPKETEEKPEVQEEPAEEADAAAEEFAAEETAVSEVPNSEEEEPAKEAPIEGTEPAAEPQSDAEAADNAEPEADNETAVPEFMEITGLTEVVQSLEEGKSIVGITYSEGLGEYADWFYTTDPWEIQDIWTSLQMMETDGPTKWFATDWYPAVELYLSDYSVYRVAFNGHWLDTPEGNYQLKNDEMFWTLTSLLEERYRDLPMDEMYYDYYDEEYGDDFDYGYDEGDPDPAGTASEDALDAVPNAVDLYLPANPTTGYTWTVEIEEEGIVEVKDQYFPDSQALGFTGSGGTHWFHFDGLQEGVASVKLSYQRPWEDGEALYVFIYRLSVDDQNNVMIWGVEMNP